MINDDIATSLLLKFDKGMNKKSIINIKISI